MITGSWTLQSLLIAGALAKVLIVSPAFAQQTGDQPASPPEAPEADPAAPGSARRGLTATFVLESKARKRPYQGPRPLSRAG